MKDSTVSARVENNVKAEAYTRYDVRERTK